MAASGSSATLTSEQIRKTLRELSVHLDTQFQKMSGFNYKSELPASKTDTIVRSIAESSASKVIPTLSREEIAGLFIRLIQEAPRTGMTPGIIADVAEALKSKDHLALYDTISKHIDPSALHETNTLEILYDIIHLIGSIDTSNSFSFKDKEERNDFINYFLLKTASYFQGNFGISGSSDLDNMLTTLKNSVVSGVFSNTFAESHGERLAPKRKETLQIVSTQQRKIESQLLTLSDKIRSFEEKIRNLSSALDLENRKPSAQHGNEIEKLEYQKRVAEDALKIYKAHLVPLEATFNALNKAKQDTAGSADYFQPPKPGKRQ